MTEAFLWIKDILLMIVGLSFFQILIPESSIEKYLKFIFSLVIMATILDPLLHFIENLQ